MRLRHTIDFWELPCRQTFVLLEEQYARDILKATNSYADNNLAKASESIRTTKSIFDYLRTNRRVRVDKLLKLLNFLNDYNSTYSLESAQKYLVWIGPMHGRGIPNPHFPVNQQNPPFVRTAARACGDGMLTKIYGPRHGFGSLIYFAKDDHEQMENAIEDAIVAFGGNPQTYRINYGKDTYLVYPTVVRDIMLASGVMPSPKAESNLGVLKFVMESEKGVVWSAWLQQTADDEGTVCHYPQHNLYGINWRRSTDITGLLPNFELKERERVSIHNLRTDVQRQIANRPPKLLLDERELLDRLGVSSAINPLETYRTVNGKLRASWKLSIGGPDNLRQFGRKIGFHISRKSNLLANAMELSASYEKFILPIINGVQHRHGYIEAASVSMMLSGCLVPYSNKTTISAIVALREMSKRGYIRKINEGQYIKNLKKYVPSRYAITDKGIRRLKDICDQFYYLDEKVGGGSANKVAAEIPTAYNPLEVEPKWQKKWKELGINDFRRADYETPTYVIDTPPPYSSQEGGAERGVPHGHRSELDVLRHRRSL